MPKVSELKTEFTAVSSFAPVEPEPVAELNKVETATETPSSPEQESNEDIPTATTEDTEETCNIIKELGGLPVNMGEMFEALNTARTCFEAFAPLLHILLATDPLDWKASFWVCAPRGINRSEAQSASLSVESAAKSGHHIQSAPLLMKQSTLVEK